MVLTQRRSQRLLHKADKDYQKKVKERTKKISDRKRSRTLLNLILKKEQELDILKIEFLLNYGEL